MSRDYIPDLTERFPEGFDGVDMTPSFYGEPVDWSRAYGYEESMKEKDYENDPVAFPRETPLYKTFNIGDEIRDYEFDGGITDYKIVKFNKDRTKVFVTEHWINIDGEGKRKPHWCNLVCDDIGEKFQPDSRYDSWIRKDIY